MSGAKTVPCWLLAAVLGLGLTACSNGAKKGGNGPNANIDASSKNVAKCTALKDHIAGLYKKEQPPDKDPKKQARREAVMADNVNMVLSDCAKSPDRFAPCIKGATSVAQLEKSCLVKLDDEGTVEGDYFKGKP